MTLGLEFHPEAMAELLADADWYAERDVVLGERFELAVRIAIDAVLDAPNTWATWPGWKREPTVRSKGVTGFPYRVVYLVGTDVVVIVAVAHAKRRPGYWRERLLAD
jgi:hypothetical protein